MKPKIVLILITLVLFTAILSAFTTAATIKGTIYNTNLEVETDVLVEIDTVPQQKFLAKEGTYNFDVPLGKYTLTADKGLVSTTEEVEIVENGEFIFDLFLLSDFTEEDELWQDTEEEFFTEDEKDEGEGYSLWRSVLTGLIILALLIRLLWMRKKYGRLKIFRKKIKAESKKTVEQHKEELAEEPGHLDKVLEIIQRHDGRITQKKLRKEMLYLSEAKVSLILTELEHKGKIEKVKKGRGNVVLLKG